MSESLKLKLTEFYNEEIADMEKYRMFANTLEEEHPHWAGIFRDIANDENAHANIIGKIMSW